MKDTEKKTKIRKSIGKLTDGEKWNLLSDYIGMKLSNTEIMDKYNLYNIKRFEDFIRNLYKGLVNSKETRTLIRNFRRTSTSSLVKSHILSEDINEAFFKETSTAELPLTEKEILFCMFYIEYGDDHRALVDSGLDIGLKRDQKNYKEAVLLRAFYLKKKENTNKFINEQKLKSVQVLKEGKDYFQSKLLVLIDQLEALDDKRNLPSVIKLLDMIGRTLGAFDDKLDLTGSANGDEILDSILKRAKSNDKED